MFRGDFQAAGTVAASKNSAWAIAAFTVERWNGLVIRNVGSGRVPGQQSLGERSDEDHRHREFGENVLHRVDSARIVGELDVGKDQARRVLARLRDRLVASHRDAGDVMAEIADDRLDIHRDDRLVLDDQHVGESLALDLFERLGDERIDVGRADVDQIARILRRKAFERRQQQRLSRSGVILESRA